MMKSLLFSALAVMARARPDDDAHTPVVPAAPVNTCNHTCLTVEVVDFYGDGWDSVMLHGELEGYDGSMTLAPDCANKHVTQQLCLDRDSTFYFTAMHHNASYIPENYWEVFWKATSHNCDGSVANVWTGGFNSSLILDYVGNSWHAQYWENLWDNEKQCDACGDAAMCKPKKPKNKGGKNKNKGGKKPGKPMDGKKGGKGGKGGDDDKGGMGSDDDMTGNATTTMNTTKTVKRYGPPAVNLRVTMFDERGDGWWKNDYSGASWYLADDRREKLFHSGTLCDGSVGYCNLCLGDGSYTMRFTGEASNFTAWDFCGVTGHRATELTFHVSKGACYADSIVSLRTECMGTVESTVSLTGVVAISGFATELVTEGAYPAISKTLASMIQGWSAENIKIVSSTLDARSTSSRRLSDFTQDFTFEVSFIAEKAFGVDGRSYSNVENLADNLASTLSNKMASGQFETSLQLELSLSNVVSLSSSSTAELISLQVSTVKYEGSDDLSVSTLPPVDYNSYTSTQTVSKYNVESIAVFFGVAIVGFVAFVGIMRQGVAGNSYETLADESAHAMDVKESEMEDSTSPMVHSAFSIDATPTTSLKL
jgi:hypothetical protein